MEASQEAEPAGRGRARRSNRFVIDDNEDDVVADQPGASNRQGTLF